jgi:hypothetical protein
MGWLKLRYTKLAFFEGKVGSKREDGQQIQSCLLSGNRCIRLNVKFKPAYKIDNSAYTAA